MDPNPETKICTNCGQTLPLSSLTPFNGELLCPECLAELTVSCSWCGDRIWRDDNYGTDDTPLCRKEKEKRRYIPINLIALKSAAEKY